MTEQKSLNDREVANVQVGYENAVAAFLSESEVIWSKFNAFVVANSILLGAIALGLTDSRTLTSMFFHRYLPGGGLILAVLWFLLLKRSFDHHIHFVWSAVELESLLEPVRMLQKGGEFAEAHKPVTYSIRGAQRTLRPTPMVGRVRVETVTYLIIAVFAGLYLVLLFSP
jgi:hypothetical protein